MYCIRSFSRASALSYRERRHPKMQPNATVVPVAPFQNLFIHGLFPNKDESRRERVQRERDAKMAVSVSNAIDEQIQQEKIATKRGKSAAKVLLLGESESGWRTLVVCVYDP